MANQKKAGKKQPAKKKEKKEEDSKTTIKKEIRDRVLNAHNSFFKNLPFGLRMFLSILVDGIDMITGMIPGVNMAGTMFTLIAGLALWGDLGFLTAWEFLPELAGFTTALGTGGLSHVISAFISLCPSTTICGIVWRYRNRKGKTTAARRKKVATAKWQIRPEMEDLKADIQDYFCNVEVRPEMKQLIADTKNGVSNSYIRAKNSVKKILRR